MLGVAAAFAATAAAHLALARGEAAGVIEATDLIVPIAGRDGIREPGVLLWHAVRADALVAVGRLDDAATELEGFEALATRRGGARRWRMRPGCAATWPPREATSPRPRPRSRRGPGTWAKGRGACSGALLHDAYGRVLRRAGRRRAAVEQLEAALALYAAMGAAPYQACIHDELTACGRRRPRRAPGPSAELTPQELAVARLVAAGLSNRDVATQLVVSVKTVEYHLQPAQHVPKARRPLQNPTRDAPPQPNRRPRELNRTATKRHARARQVRRRRRRAGQGREGAGRRGPLPFLAEPCGMQAMTPNRT